MIPIGRTDAMQRTLHTAAEIGSVIRAERKALGLTQGDLAAASGVSLRFLSELERGRESAGVGRVLHVLDMLGLEVVVESPGGADDG
jgi:y4mF family transcriptional regulator